MSPNNPLSEEEMREIRERSLHYRMEIRPGHAYLQPLTDVCRLLAAYDAVVKERDERQRDLIKELQRNERLESDRDALAERVKGLEYHLHRLIEWNENNLVASPAVVGGAKAALSPVSP